MMPFHKGLLALLNHHHGWVVLLPLDAQHLLLITYLLLLLHSTVLSAFHKYHCDYFAELASQRRYC